MDVVTLIKALVLGIVEGLTEFLPVSSTAHLILLSRALGFDDPSGSFKVMIQLGAILAIMVVFAGKIWDTVTGLPTKPEARRFALGLFVAFLPAVAAGVLLADFVETLFLEGQISPAAGQIIATTLIVGGLLMLVVERFRPTPTDMAADALPLWKSLAIGCCQCVALIPGVSRSGATIIGAMLFGVERRAAAEFSFFLACRRCWRRSSIPFGRTATNWTSASSAPSALVSWRPFSQRSWWCACFWRSCPATASRRSPTTASRWAR
jgi:undecaprenyl-diphosphatase